MNSSHDAGGPGNRSSLSPRYTVAELIRELAKLPVGTLVVLSRDPEGNGFSPLAEVIPCAYQQGQWDGEISDGTGAVCLWPVT